MENPYAEYVCCAPECGKVAICRTTVYQDDGATDVRRPEPVACTHNVHHCIAHRVYAWLLLGID